jgi:hypothetical protein
MRLGRSRADAHPATTTDPVESTPPLETMTAPAFRALVAERLRSLERDLTEVRTRVNGLLFVVAGAAVTQVVRLFG